MEVADSVEVVRSRCERRDVRGSSCQTDAEVLALLYSFPYSNRQEAAHASKERSVPLQEAAAHVPPLRGSPPR